MKILLVLCLLGLLGCAEPTPAPGVEVELGTGSFRFEPLEDGQQVALVRGAQGGFHLWLSLRVRGLEDSRPAITWTMQPADETRAPHEVQVALPFDPPDAAGFRKLIGYTGIVKDPACLVGKLLRIEASLPMAGGELVSVEREVVVLGGTYPPATCEEQD